MVLINTLREYGKLVVFSNTLFSLSFGIAAIILVNNQPAVSQLFWVFLALLSGRTAANAFNRIADKDIDGLNPRTANRHLPANTLSYQSVVLFTSACFILLTVSSAMLSRQCLFLLPFALGVIILYSYAKRFTWLCHLILGVASALAPLGVWIALSGTIDQRGWMLAIANCFWVAGFDIIYALQDMEFDRKQGLYSIPARFGMQHALTLSALCHGMTFLALMFLGLLMPFSIFGWLGLITMAGLMVFQHYTARQGLERMEFASMAMSRYISLFLLILIAFEA